MRDNGIFQKMIEQSCYAVTGMADALVFIPTIGGSDYILVRDAPRYRVGAARAGDAENHRDCKRVDCQGGVCMSYSAGYYRGCALSDGSVGECLDQTCTEKESGEIPCEIATDDWPDGTLCRSPDGREGTCFHGLCGSEDLCDGVICEDDLCGSGAYCNWAGDCEFERPTYCDDGSTCTFDSCDPDRGCVYERRPNGAGCSTDPLCTILTLGTGCLGTCQDGLCE